MSKIKDVYNSIAKEFDQTRYSVWKGVRNFLDKIPIDSLVGDIGCGNGKNMLYRKDIRFQGYDISEEFVQICKNKGLNTNLGDITNLDINDNTFDYIISIAVIHHLSTRLERIKAISELVRVTKKNGKILIYVWAYEQPKDSRRKFQPGDNYVPFITSQGITNRFYHVYTQGELEEEIKEIENCIIENIFYELGNWVTILTKK